MKTKAMDGHATIITCVSGYSSQRATGPRRAFYSITKGTYALEYWININFIKNGAWYTSATE